MRTVSRSTVSSLGFSAAFAIAALAGLQGCKKPEYPACKKDKHCDADAGEKCVDGTCQNCTTDEECKGKGEGGADFVCHEFRCTDPNAVGGDGDQSGQGAPCTAATDCEGGWACKAGICDACTEDGDCSNGTCNLATGRCSPEGQCQVDDDCPMDEICDGGMCVFSGDLGETGGGPCGLDAVYFAFDSDKITPQAQQQLETAAACITEQNAQVFLEAHADNVGTEEYNILLTERRGQSVKQLLVTLGVPDANLQVIAKGSMMAVGMDEAARSKDRRVQFIWKQ